MPKVKIPKRIAGVKIPKKVRRKVKKAARMAESPVVREVAAAAAAAAVQARAARAQARAAAAEAGGSAMQSGDATIHIDGDRLVETVKAAALDGLRRFLEGLDEGLREIDADRRDDARPQANGRRAGASAD